MRPTVRRIVVVVVLAVTLVPLLLVNARVYRPGDLETARAQLRFLERSLAEGGAERMQQLFPEGFVFTWALYGLASAQVASALPASDADRDRYLSEALVAARRVRTFAARAPYRPDMDPPYGAFYASWTVYVLAEYVRAAGGDTAPAEVITMFREEASRFAAALRASETPYLESYPYLVWPGDTAVGVAALGIYNRVIEPEFVAEVERWVRDARARLDPEVRALSHEARVDGEPTAGVRGSSLALMSRVLVDADPDFAREQYEVLRERFVDQRLLAPGVREYPHGVTGADDVDSGPIVLGFSGPALVVGAAAARAHGDERLADVLLSVTEGAGFPVQWGGRRRYIGGMVPVGDAFIAWATTTPLRVSEAAWPPLISSTWRVAGHLLSLAFTLLLLLRARSLWRRTD
jgi:hypothetical protein